uniref:Uncharacterized protein n=1 Tax=Nelumbo nucifera TaxID=4432 RepID=A0A822ZQ13_NELNU|nr:TPA_asm: hypothetical protein HUJ06_003841 [Nelumbo nucifera]
MNILFSSSTGIINDLFLPRSSLITSIALFENFSMSCHLKKSYPFSYKQSTSLEEKSTKLKKKEKKLNYPLPCILDNHRTSYQDCPLSKVPFLELSGHSDKI